jgi:hypothetical protein
MLFKDESQAGSPKKKQEQERRRFLLRIADEYYRQGGLPAYVKAIFPRQFVPDDSWIEKLAKRFRMARPTSASIDKPLKIDLGNNTICTFFVEALPEDAGEYRQWICASNSVGWVRAITGECLTEKITEKAKKLPAYQKAAEQIMLLLVTERIQASGMLDYSPGPTLLPSQGFSEVHLLINPLKSCRIA